MTLPFAALLAQGVVWLPSLGAELWRSPIATSAHDHCFLRVRHDPHACKIFGLYHDRSCVDHCDYVTYLRLGRLYVFDGGIFRNGAIRSPLFRCEQHCGCHLLVERVEI